MARTLTTGASNAAQAVQVRDVYFIQISYAADPIYAWTGPYSISWNGQTWLPTGRFMTISSVLETADDRDQDLTLTLSGVDPSNVTDVLANDIQGSAVLVYCGFLNDGAETLIADPVQIFGGVVDVPVINDGSTVSISVSCRSLHSALRGKNERRYTPDDQKLDYATDLGLDYVPQMPTVNLLWGSPGQNGPSIAVNTTNLLARFKYGNFHI